jgi:hypothetical protein
VYLDDSHNTADAAAQMELKWRALRNDSNSRAPIPW